MRRVHVIPSTMRRFKSKGPFMNLQQDNRSPDQGKLSESMFWMRGARFLVFCVLAIPSLAQMHDGAPEGRSAVEKANLPKTARAIRSRSLSVQVGVPYPFDNSDLKYYSAGGLSFRMRIASMLGARLGVGLSSSYSTFNFNYSEFQRATDYRGQEGGRAYAFTIGVGVEYHLFARPHVYDLSPDLAIGYMRGAVGWLKFPSGEAQGFRGESNDLYAELGVSTSRKLTSVVWGQLRFAMTSQLTSEWNHHLSFATLSFGVCLRPSLSRGGMCAARVPLWREC